MSESQQPPHVRPQEPADTFLDEIDDLLEPDAEAFVAAYVQENGNGGFQYIALVERLIDATDVQLATELLKFIQLEFQRWMAPDEIRSGFDPGHLVEAIRLRFGSDVASYLNVPFLDADQFQEALTLVLGEAGVTAPPLETVDLADDLEVLAKRAILDGRLVEAGEQLASAIRLDPARDARLNAEFEFLLAQPQGLTDGLALWLSGLWCGLAASSSFDFLQVPSFDGASADLTSVSDVALIADDEISESTLEDSPATSRDPRSTRGSQQTGAVLETAVLRLLRRFFMLAQDDEEYVLHRLRRQRSGSQFGMDIQFDCSSVKNEYIRCHVECKNYQAPLTLRDVGEKVLQTEVHWRAKPLDHLIFISPHTSTSNELDLALQDWSSSGRFPFTIQVWGPDERVQDLFALEPVVYEAVYGEAPPDLETGHVVTAWSRRLLPNLRLPLNLRKYLTSPRLHCIAGENAAEFEELAANAVPLRVSDEVGKPLGGLEDCIDRWLAREKPNNLLLLGEFGDGKSFSCYSATRRLGDSLVNGRDLGTLAIRLPLRDLRAAGTGRELLDRRLREIGSNISEWLSAQTATRTLVILDGFDEMSVSLDQLTIAENMRLLAGSIRDLHPARVLVTSRTHFFETRRDQDRFLEQLGRPAVLRLTPVPRVKRLEHLANYARERGLEDKLLRLRRLYDPIGLAGKPLFLQMIKETLGDLPDHDFNEIVLYQTYVRNSLERKIEFLEDPLLTSTQDELVQGMGELLERMAVQMQSRGEESFDLRALTDDGESQDLVRTLWRISDSGAASDSAQQDVTARVGMRSLLRRVSGASDQWRVAFFHRSMREYFVALGILRALRGGAVSGRAVLASLPMQPEITNFLVAMIRGSSDQAALLLLLQSLARSAVRGTPCGLLGGNSLTLLCRMSAQLPRRGWNNLDLDLADLSGADLSSMELAGSSLRGAVLDNADLTGADLTDCDLTGVRLEETAAVVSVAVASERSAVVGYEDGSVRLWSWATGSDAHAGKVLEGADGLEHVAIGAYDTIVVIARRMVQVLLQRSDRLVSLLRFRLRNDVRKVHLGEAGVLHVLHERGATATTALVEFECEPRRVTSVRAAGGVGPFAATRNSAVVPWGEGAVVLGEARGRRVQSAAIPTSWTSCVALRQQVSGRELALLGDNAGQITCLELDLNADNGPPGRLLWRTTAHQGVVSAVAFLSDDAFVSGGADRLVVVHELEESGPRSVAQLRLSLSCRGVRYEGVRGQAEYERLRYLAETAAEEG